MPDRGSATAWRYSLAMRGAFAVSGKPEAESQCRSVEAQQTPVTSAQKKKRAKVRGRIRSESFSRSCGARFVG